MVEHGVYAGVRERETPQPLRVSTASVSLGGHGASTARRNLAEVVTLFDARTQAGRRNLQSTAPNPQLCVESEQARRAGLRADKAVRRRGLELELELELALAITTPAAAQVDASRESSARLTTSHRVSSCMEYGEECRRKGQGRPDKGGHGERTNTRGAGQS